MSQAIITLLDTPRTILSIPDKVSYITVLDTGKGIKIPLFKVKCVTACGAYSCIQTNTGRQYAKSWHLNRIQTFIEHTNMFFRSERAWLVNLYYIDWVKKWPKGFLILIDGTSCRLSRRQSSKLKLIHPTARQI